MQVVVSVLECMDIVLHSMDVASKERHLNVTFGGEQLVHHDFVGITTMLLSEMKLCLNKGAAALHQLVWGTFFMYLQWFVCVNKRVYSLQMVVNHCCVYASQLV